jgi:hypothetical protein
LINLGDEVIDTVSGFKGIAISKHLYLQGCARISVQPPIDKDGKLPETASFDETQLKVVEKQKIRQGFTDTGGPDKYADEVRDSHDARAVFRKELVR